MQTTPIAVTRELRAQNGLPRFLTWEDIIQVKPRHDHVACGDHGDRYEATQAQQGGGAAGDGSCRATLYASRPVADAKVEPSTSPGIVKEWHRGARSRCAGGRGRRY